MQDPTLILAPSETVMEDGWEKALKFFLKKDHGLEICRIKSNAQLKYLIKKETWRKPDIIMTTAEIFKYLRFLF